MIRVISLCVLMMFGFKAYGGAAELCAAAQLRLAGLDRNARVRVFSEEKHDLSGFLRSKPSLGESRDLIRVFAYQPQVNFGEVGRVWCKLKRQTVIESKLGLTPVKNVENCAGIAGFWLKKSGALGNQVSITDKGFKTGKGWADSSVDIEVKGGFITKVVTKSLVTPDILPFVGGMHYCKLPYIQRQ